MCKRPKHAAPVSLLPAQSLQRITDMLTMRLQAFGRRERLTVTWQPAGPSAAGPDPAG